MKKLMMAVAIVCAAAFAQAGIVNWGSGLIYAPNEETGALTTTRLNNAMGYSLKMYAWESFTAADVAFTTGDLFAWYADGAKGSAFEVKTLTATVNMTASTTQATAAGELVGTADQSVYAAVLLVLEKDGQAAWYMENAGTTLAKAGSTKATLSNLASKVGGGTTGDATSWTAVDVPEPTSGLLLVLGMAGLALRRRRA